MDRYFVAADLGAGSGRVLAGAFDGASVSLQEMYQLYSMVDLPALEQAATLLLMPNLFDYWLTGVKAAEFSVATTTQFCDPALSAWTTDLLVRLGLPAAFLPPVMPS